MRALLVASLCLLTLHCEAQSNEAAAGLVQSAKADIERGYFTQAAVSLHKAITLEPGNVAAHALLARAYLGRGLAPMLPDPEGVLPKAAAEAKEALRLAPDDGMSLLAMGSIKRNLAARETNAGRKKLLALEARGLLLRALASDPNLLDAHNELAEMALTQAMWPILGARAASGVPMGKPGWVPDAETRRTLRSRFGASIEEGIQHSQAALAIDPNYEKSMRSLGALLLLRSVIQETEAQSSADSRASQEWSRKADALPRPAPGPLTEDMKRGGILGGVIGSLPSTVPPPPPPQPSVQ